MRRECQYERIDPYIIRHTWSKGATGVLPWHTIGNEHSWKIAEETALFYPHISGPVASVRLKAFTAGQQLVEYLTLLSDITGMPRFAVTQWLGKVIGLDRSLYKTSEADAGEYRFGEDNVMDLWALRYRVGKFLSEKEPEYKRVLVSREVQDWRSRKLPDIGHVTVAPEVESMKPDIDRFKP